MKALYSLALASIFCIQYVQASSLVIDVQEQQATSYLITINNQTTYQTSSSLTINQLYPGDHQITIVKQQTFFNRRNRSLGNHYGHYGQQGHSNQQSVVVFEGIISIPPYAQVYSYLDYNNLIIQQIVSENTYGYTNPTTCTMPPVSYVPAVPQEMDAYSFQTLVQTIGNEPFGDNKLRILKLALAQNMVNSNQVLVLLEEFTFDDDKLQAAKLAYPRTVDPQNYYLVTNGFTFGSTKNKLAQYIASR